MIIRAIEMALRAAGSVLAASGVSKFINGECAGNDARGVHCENDIPSVYCCSSILTEIPTSIASSVTSSRRVAETWRSMGKGFMA